MQGYSAFNCRSMHSNFLLGAIKMTGAARLALKRHPYDLIARHAINEHGKISQAEMQENLFGMRSIGPIISRYVADPTDASSPHVLVITADTWNETIVSLEGQ